jgi:inner membrane protein
MNWFADNLAQSFFVAGLILLVIEVAVLGFATFILFFAGIAAMITGTLIYFQVLPDSLLPALLCTGLITAISALLLWKPLKKMQNQVDTTKAKGDLVGHTFVLSQAVSASEKGKYRYSGIDWTLVSNEALSAGTKVEVTEAEVGVFHIKARP